MLRLEDDWIWDSWIADDGENYHLYFLKAPRSLGNPSRRHLAATIGHASSKDLVEWTYHGQTLGPSAQGWDDLAIWTGSVVRADDGRWLLYYTAVNTGGRGVKDQRIGVARSTDLHTWERIGDAPIVSPDRRWYKTLDSYPEASETWRDPKVFRDPAGDGWHMYITARSIEAGPNDDGVIAHARSADLLTWEVGPPLCEPGQGFGQLEVLQPAVIDSKVVMVFTCHPQEMTAARIAELGEHCTWSVPGDSLTGPWDIARTQPFRAEPHLFAAPLVQQRDGTWALVGFRNREPEGIWSFDILDPIPVTIDEAGSVQATQAYVTSLQAAHAVHPVVDR